MQLFRCPWCGQRAQIEFSYCCDQEGIPGPDWAELADEAHLQRIYLRSNQIGFHAELWQHTGGCGGWLKILRHNLTHEVADTVPADRNLEVPAT